jgi:hypothetical protein
MMPPCGIGANLQYVMMQFSLLPTLVRRLVTRFHGLAKRNEKLLPIICPSSRVVSGSLMGLSLIFGNLKTMLLIDLSSMGRKKYIA